MSRYRGPLTRLSRRLGVILFTNGASKTKSFHKKRYKPGMHGQKMTGKLSEFGKQLQEKQKARVTYGISEKQSQNYYKNAKRNSEATGDQYIKFLELRLDNVIYRAGLALTRQQARQMVNHGLIKLNDKRADVPSIQVKEGDKFEVRKQKKESPLFNEIKKSKYHAPKWLKVNISNLSGEIIKLPEIEDIDSTKTINTQLIVEYYSK